MRKGYVFPKFPKGCVGLAKGYVGLAKGYVGLAKGYVGLAKGYVGLAKGYVGLVRKCLLSRSEVEESCTQSCSKKYEPVFAHISTFVDR